MLYASLVCSGIILAVALLAARYSEHPIRVTLGWASGVAVLPMGLMMGFPAVWLQLAILGGGLLFAGLFGRARRALVPLSVVSVVVAYGVIGVSVSQEEARLDELRARYPFESMEARLPRPVPASASGSPEILTRLEQEVERESGWRNHQLARLHTVTVDRFVNSPGFGVGRMTHRLGRPGLEGELRDSAPDQPEDYFRLAPKDGEKLPARPDQSALGKLHEAGFLDFVNPRGFGYVKDRRHVAGFLSHGFSKVPEPAGGWKVATLELIGLLRHDNPVVYVSPKLPRMEELKGAPTRPLDAFETAALDALRGGADLHTEDGTDDGLRFLGAIRSTRQCVGCHGGERGALLGAFTYRLKPAGNEVPRR
jgi:hypothetical protein